jgi:hypothetical protein
MSAITNIALNFIAEYKGRQHVKAAQSDLEKLASLGKKLGVAFSVAGVVAFGKSAVDAFVKSDQQFKILSKTLTNMGLESQTIGLNDYINKLSLATGVTQDSLIPALSELSLYTGDVTKAQDLLALSMDVSAGTSTDLATTVDAISKAYGGNFKALSKLGSGMNANVLKMKDFATVQKYLTNTFKGDAAAAADTYAGRLQRVGEAVTQMKENLGQGLIAGFSGANSSAQSFADTLQKIVDFGTTAGAWTGAIIAGLGKITAGIEKIPGLSYVLKHTIDGWDKILGVTDAVVAAHDALLRQNDQLQQKANQDAKAQAKLAKERQIAQAKADFAAGKAARDKLALEKASLSLKLAGQTTDMQNIEIQAALQRGQSKDVENVLLLQRAILSGNADEANLLAQAVLGANDLVMKVNGDIGNLASAKDPFGDWPAASEAARLQLAAIQLALDQLVSKPYIVQIQTMNTVSTGSNGVVGSIPTMTDSSILANIGSGSSTLGDYLAGVANNGMYAQPGSGVSTIGDYLNKTNNNGLYSNPGNGASTIGDYNAGVNVTVMLNGQSVSNAITSAQVDQSASGIPNSFQRNYAGGW